MPPVYIPEMALFWHGLEIYKWQMEKNKKDRKMVFTCT